MPWNAVHLCHSLQFRDWSHTGGAGQAQPDNREQVRQGGEEEACMAVLNNFYGDGEDIGWPSRAARAGEALNNPRSPVKSITETAQGWNNFLCKF